MGMEREIRAPRLRAGPVAGGPGAALGRAVPGLALCALGVAVLLVARGQAAWLGGDVGPGLMAQLLGKGIAALGGVWVLMRVLEQPEGCASGCGRGGAAGDAAQRWSGPALLGAVLVFALALPEVGMVLAAGLAAVPAALGAGERSARALGVTAAGLMALTAAIGLALLPPTAPLWP
jgi:hypothetical protein